MRRSKKTTTTVLEQAHTPNKYVLVEVEEVCNTRTNQTKAMLARVDDEIDHPVLEY